MRFRSPASIGPRTAYSPRSRAAAPARSTRRAKFAPVKPKMRSPGSRRLRRKLLVRSTIPIAGVWVAAAAFALPAAALAQALRTYVVTGDAIPQSLTGLAGDATPGRAMVLDRTSHPTHDHPAPLPHQKSHSQLAPGLDGAGV